LDALGVGRQNATGEAFAGADSRFAAVAFQSGAQRLRFGRGPSVRVHRCGRFVVLGG